MRTLFVPAVAALCTAASLFAAPLPRSVTVADVVPGQGPRRLVLPVPASDDEAKDLVVAFTDDDQFASAYGPGVPSTGVADLGTAVVSQVYGGGGNSGAPLKNDYIELYNPGSADVSLEGWSVQYGSSAGSTWQVTPLSGVIGPGGYYLIREAAGAGAGSALPTPDATGVINMSSASGKVALVSNTVALLGACPSPLAFVDLVGYGAANCAETSPTTVLNNTTAAQRNGEGSVDTNDNSADFTVAGPNPRNSATPSNTSSQPPQGRGAASPASVLAGDSTLLTVAVAFGVHPDSTSVSVVCDLTAIGGATTQGFVDDGTEGDTTPDDRTFSFQTVVPSSTTPGAKVFACTLVDDLGRSSLVPITLIVVSPGGAVVLSTNLSGTLGSQTSFTLNVPAGQTTLTFTISGGIGDADLYVKFGAPPTTSAFDCSPFLPGNNETCTFNNPAPGTWFVMLRGFSAYSGVTLTGTYAPDTTPPLTNGVPVAGISDGVSSERLWKLSVPAGKSSVTFTINGGTGDADLYVRRGARPTTAAFDCRPFLVGNNETCTISNPTAGDWFVMIRGYSAYSGLTLQGQYP
jgi:Lamin Tail Domain/Bacterial pre-peptidase C-terminal domain